MAKATAKNDVPADKLALYERLVATIPSVERKGATVPYTAVNGHMFSYLTKSGALALRLPKDALAAFLAKYESTLCEAYGVVQNEYAMVPDALLKKTPELARHFAVSHAYVAAMKPKPKTRKKK